MSLYLYIYIYLFSQVDLSANGRLMMKNFLHGICGFPGDFSIKNREAKCIDYIRERVGENKVLVIIRSKVLFNICQKF